MSQEQDTAMYDQPDNEGDEMSTQLEDAEQELYEWATGNRSWEQEHRKREISPEDRVRTLIEATQHDAAEIDLATKKVTALRLLAANKEN